MSSKSLSVGLQAFCKAHQADSPESAMRAACAGLLSSCGLQDPPIPLKPLARKLGIELRWMEKRKVNGEEKPDALLGLDREGLVAFLYPDRFGRNWRRSRFSLAHEIGHALLIRTLGDSALIASLESTPEFYRQTETLCDIAASEILMPPRSVRKAIKESDFTPGGLVRLYDQFMVSRGALIRRLASIMPHASVVRWKVYARSEGESREMRVLGSFPGYNRISPRPWLPSGCTTRHLDPPIVDWAALRQEAVLDAGLRIVLGGRSQECVGMATFFPADRTRDQQPSFEGFRVPDEQVRTPEILLFAADKVMAGEAVAWEFKKE